MDNGASSYRRFLAGDDEGLHEIIREYRQGLILYINSFVQNIRTAEEMTEDTFAELAIRCPKFSEKSSFKTWLYAIGRNITAKHLRKRAKFIIVPLESQENLADEKSIEGNYIKSEQKRAVHKALHSLKTEYRQVLYLSYFEGFSNEETAIIMKKSKRQIETLLYNARKALKTELERGGFEYEE
ncbi:MAG: RNA polymerase sigma factor [Ruminococcus sp.]|uniref:RNA polymerase sigma factor n=1 Tax=Ruminococcus sp. TaxID=41978 RepID=UPI0025ED9C13|nr:RNA polymerase sigma factor [Ruminococcus sp.]MBR5683109.1 RNA polymerase sigma factor [Ruminococcus sp.]